MISVLIPAGNGLFAGGNMNSMMAVGGELASRGHEISIIAGNYYDQLKSIERGFQWARWYPIRLHPDRRGVGRGLEFLGKGMVHVARHVRKNEDAILHVHSGYPQFGYLSTFSRLTKGLKTIQTVYCPLRCRVDDRNYWGLSPRLAQVALQSHDAVVAVSQNIRKDLIDLGIQDSKIRVIPPCVNGQRYSETAGGRELKRELGIGPNVKLLVYSGNATKTKGLDVLVEAYIRLRRETDNVHLVMALQHQYSKDAEGVIRRLETELNRESGPDSYTRLGIIKNMPQLVSSADIFVSPLRDTHGPADWPVSTLEAMAAGRCVVTTSVGGIPEFVTDGMNGRLVSPGEVEPLVIALRDLLSDDRLRAEMGARAARKIKEQLSPARIADMTEELYREVRHGGPQACA